MKRQALFCSLLGSGLLLLNSESALGTTFTVTNLNDSGAGSLRDAITQANNTGGDDIIVFAGGLAGTIQLQSELPYLSTNIDLQGPGSSVVTVSRQTGGAYRIFTISKNGYPGPTVRISGLRIINGNTPFILPPQNFGGGVYNDYGSVTIQNCEFGNNISAYGGAIYSGPPGPGPGVPTSCTVLNCVFDGNHARWKGGAIMSSGGQDGDATLYVSGCTFTSNTTDNEGGGAIAIEAGNGATTNVTVLACTFSANNAGTQNTSFGGAILNTVFRGGSSSVTVRNSWINSNQAVKGGGIYNWYSTADTGTATVDVSGCTFENNTATSEGGGAYNFAATSSGATGTANLTLTNCTLAGNSAPEGAALLNVGGANSAAYLNVTACTLRNNPLSDGSGSGIFSRALNGGTGLVRLSGSILATTSGTNLGNDVGSIQSFGYNLSTDSGSGFLVGQAEQQNSDPKFDPAGLTNNGGPTKTIALSAGSPAIDASQAFGVSVDQRGSFRPFDNSMIPNAVNGNGADIGAFEVQGDPVQGGIPSLVVNVLEDHDDGICGAADCTLREAIARSNALTGPNTITFSAALFGSTIILNGGGELVISDVTTVSGPDARILTVTGNQTHRVFVNSSTATISGLTIREGWNAFGGSPGDTRQGGAVYNSGTLTFNDCGFTANYAKGENGPTSGNGGAGQGGAIYSTGTLNLNRCLFYRTSTGNLAVGGNGGAGVGSLSFGGAGGNGQGAAVFSAATGNLLANNCTFEENSANGGNGGSGGFGGNGGSGQGGGIYSLGSMTIIACTITANNGTGGSGGTGNTPENDGKSGNGKGGLVRAGGQTSIGNTLVAANSAAPVGSFDVDGAFTSAGYNLIGTADHSTGFTATGDQTGTDAARINPQLASLQDNGGPTKTIALLPGSPAIDKGKGFNLTTDQRGFPRTLDDPVIPNATNGDGTDIGAFEADAPQAGVTLIVTTNQDHDDGLCGYNDCTLREAINAANTLAGDNTVTFKAGVTGTISLGSTLPNVASNVNIQGPGARTLEVNGNTAYRVFSFTSGTSSISGLTVANGRIPATGTSGASAFGGGIFNQGTLTLFQCAIKNNSVGGGFNFSGPGGDGFGGGVFNSAVLSMDSCTVSGNTATGGGGAMGSRATNGSRGGSANGGGVYNSGTGTMTLTNSTFSGNSATGGNGGNLGNPAGNGGPGYGGIYSTGTLTMTACTVSGNSGTGGAAGSGTTNGTAGAAIGGVRAVSTTTIRNTISAGNNGGDVSGAFTSQGYNLIGPLGTATGFTATGDQTGVTNPNLGSLQDNGGPTDTKALLLSPTFSPAIDKGKSFALTTDQRGHLRIADSPSVPAATGGDNTDIGAFEFHPLSGSDTDGDGMPDEFETFYGFNPNFNGDAALDADGDGLTNLQEFQAGTDPRDPNSNLRVIVVAKNGNDFNVTFKLVVLGKSYRLERKDAMTDTFWSSINGIPDFTPAFSGSGQISDPGGASVPKHFYHIRVLP